MTLQEIRKRAKKRPGHCAVCGKALGAGRRRQAFLCLGTERKACRKTYEVAWRAVNKAPRLRLILSIGPHPKEAGLKLLELECGHSKEVPAWQTRMRRRRAVCPTCSQPSNPRRTGGRKLISGTPLQHQ